MSLHDGKVHISTGLYWGLLVSYIGGYSTFFSGLAWFLIVGYHTHETFHLIVNSVCKTFYQRVVSSSIDNIIEELASYGFNNSISAVGSFGLSCLKHCLPATAEVSGEAATGCEIDGTHISSRVALETQRTRGPFSGSPQSVDASNVPILGKFGHRSDLSTESRKPRLLEEQNIRYQARMAAANVTGMAVTSVHCETLEDLEHRLRLQESIGISSPKKAPAIRMPLVSENLN